MKRGANHTVSMPTLMTTSTVSLSHSALPVFRLTEKHTSPPEIALLRARTSQEQLFSCVGANQKGTDEPCFVYTVFLRNFTKNIVADIMRHIEALARLDCYNLLKIYGVHKDDVINTLFITTECPSVITLQSLFQDSLVTRRFMEEKDLVRLYVQYLHVAECLSEQKSLPAGLMQYLIDAKVTTFKTRELIKINTIEAYMAYITANIDSLAGSADLTKSMLIGAELSLGRGPSVGLCIRTTSSTCGSQAFLHSESTTSLLSAGPLCSSPSPSMKSLSSSYCGTETLSASTRRPSSRALSTTASSKTLLAKKTTEEALLRLINQLVLTLVVVPQLPVQITCESDPELALSIFKASVSKDFYEILRPQQILTDLAGRDVVERSLLHGISIRPDCETLSENGSLIIRLLDDFSPVQRPDIFSDTQIDEPLHNDTNSDRSGSGSDSDSECQIPTINEAVCSLFSGRLPWIATLLMMDPLREEEHSMRATFYPDEMGITSLMKAAMYNDASMAQDYIYQAGIRDMNGNTALMYCARTGAVAVAKLIVKAESGLRNKRKETALMIAVEAGNIEIVRLIVGLELSMRDFGTRNAFSIAFQNQSLDILRILLQESQAQGTLSQLVGFEAGSTTYLMRAIDMGNIELIKLLIPLMATKTNSNGMTALMLACERERTEEALALVAAEAGIQGPEGFTALMYATMRNNKCLVKELVKKEANMRTNTGEFALHLAYTFGAKDCITLLSGCENNLFQACNFTPLMRGIAYYGMASFKVMKTSYLKKTDIFGYTALMFACIFNRAEAVKELLPEEGDIVLPNGTTPFILALRNGSTESVNMIIKYYEEKLQSQLDSSGRFPAKGMLASFISNNSLSDASSSSKRSDASRLSIRDSPVPGSLGSPQPLLSSSISQTKSTPTLSTMRNASSRDNRPQIESPNRVNYTTGSSQLLLSPNVANMWDTAVEPPPQNALFDAVLSNNIDRVFALRKTHTKHTDDKGSTALMLALRKNYYDIAMILVRHEHGIQDSLKKTALMYCTDRQSLHIINALAPHEKGLADFKGKTALYHAFEDKNLVVMEKLCKYEKDSPIPILEATRKGKTLLMHAASIGDCVQLQILLPYQVGRRDGDGFCASRHAIETGNIACLKILLEKERPLLEEDGFTGLMLAVATHSTDSLVKYKNTMRRRTKDGHTALMIAVYCNNIDAVKHLATVEKGIRRHDGRTALMIAAEKDNRIACELLVQHESGIRIPANISLSNKQEIGKPVALMLAICAKSIQCLKCLSEYEAKTTETKQRMTSLMIAAQIGHVEAVQILRCLEAGEQDSLGWTALMHATAWDHPNIVRYLLAYEFSLVDENGQSALNLAVKFGQLSSVKILAPACAPQFGNDALQRLGSIAFSSSTVHSEIQTDIRRYMDLGR